MQTLDQAGVFGRVTVRVQVDTSGGVTHAVIERGIAELNGAALDWVSGVRFAPYSRDGRPASFEILIPVAFLPVRPAAAGEKP